MRALNPKGPKTGAYRVGRGGWHTRAELQTSSFRDYGGIPGTHSRDIGFRITCIKTVARHED